MNEQWAYVLKGYVQISAVNADGQNYLATVVSPFDQIQAVTGHTTQHCPF